jgi:hydrogenase assembly chaperone HypC/HupF
MKNCTGEHCLTCSDETLPVKIVQVDRQRGLALVEVHGQQEEIDITLIEQVTPGDVVLVHGGVAIAAGNEEEVDEH